MLPQSVKVYIATTPLDMRKSFDAMASLVQKVLQKEVFSGDLFVFLNRQGDKVKVLYWDRNGYCMWYKRLERGIFKLPKINGSVFKISPSELMLLLEGIDLTDKARLRAC